MSVLSFIDTLAVKIAAYVDPKLAITGTGGVIGGIILGDVVPILIQVPVVVLAGLFAFVAYRAFVAPAAPTESPSEIKTANTAS